MAGGSNKKFANGLVALSSAGVMAVYAAGFTRTRSAAEAFNEETEGRRPSAPAPAHPGQDFAAPPPRSADMSAAITGQAAKKDSPELIASVEAPALKKSDVSSQTAQSANSEAPALSASVASFAAAAAPVPAQPQVSLSAPPWKDGTYDAWGSCRHGDIQATVIVEAGKIKSAVISECATRYSCDVIDKLPPQVAVRQNENVDSVGGATQSANAFSYAVYYALAKAAAAAKGN